MNYCARCLYPENTKPTLILDNQFICSGCRYHESKSKIQIDWNEREKMFSKIIDEAKIKKIKRGNNYDCIIPVSGGKDSYYQVYVIKEVYGLNPLLVTYNHGFNMNSGVSNLKNLVDKSGCDLLRVSTSIKTAKKLAKVMLKEVGDLTWHYHAGIMTVPIKIAVEKNIPFIIWGEHGFAELTGQVSFEDFIEFTKWKRKEHDMRGYEPEDVVKISNGQLSLNEMDPFIYPSDEKIEEVDLRGIYMGNFFKWDANVIIKKMIDIWGFKPITYKRDRTFNLHAKIDDHANDVHDYLKYLKFGYGRATDDASTEIRIGRLSREEGVEMVKEYDSREPESLDAYLEFLGISKDEFYSYVDNMRDPSIWEKITGKWEPKDSISNHIINDFTEKARIKQLKERVLSKENRNLYFNDNLPPEKTGDPSFDIKTNYFTS